MKFDFKESRIITSNRNILLSNNIAQCDDRATQRPRGGRFSPAD